MCHFLYGPCLIIGGSLFLCISGNNPVKYVPAATKNFWRRRFLCGPCRVKESRWLFLPRTSCFIYDFEAYVSDLTAFVSVLNNATYYSIRFETICRPTYLHVVREKQFLHTRNSFIQAYCLQCKGMEFENFFLLVRKNLHGAQSFIIILTQLVRKFCAWSFYFESYLNVITSWLLTVARIFIYFK
jgi:hypothetical protein